MELIYFVTVDHRRKACETTFDMHVKEVGRVQSSRRKNKENTINSGFKYDTARARLLLWRKTAFILRCMYKCGEVSACSNSHSSGYDTGKKSLGGTHEEYSHSYQSAVVELSSNATPEGL